MKDTRPLKEEETAEKRVRNKKFLKNYSNNARLNNIISHTHKIGNKYVGRVARLVMVFVFVRRERLIR